MLNYSIQTKMPDQMAGHFCLPVDVLLLGGFLD